MEKQTIRRRTRILGYQGGRQATRDSRDSRRSSNTPPTITIDPAIRHGTGQDRGDEESSGKTRLSLANLRTQNENQLGQKAIYTSAQAYDKQLLSKMNAPNTKDGCSNNSVIQRKPLAAPDLRYGSICSALSLSQWQSASPFEIPPTLDSHNPFLISNSISKIFPSSWISAVTPEKFDRSSSGFQSRQNIDNMGAFLDLKRVHVGNHGLRDLDVHDGTPCNGNGEQLVLKEAEVQAFLPLLDGLVCDDRAPSQPGLLSSTAPLGPKTGPSFASMWNNSVAGSATSFRGERLSTSAPSPCAHSSAQIGQIPPYVANKNLNCSSPSPLSKIQLQYQTLSGSSQDGKLRMPSHSQDHSQQNRISELPGFLICECCPKKPKQFKNKEELCTHQMGKQYHCAYCSNRFRNKNEAERHQNSLHLKRHSWSCAALDSVHAAYHESSTHPTTADVCGYCGDEVSIPANLEVHADHLHQAHRFGECNQAKKFFRADHFRQHLKHSHAGTSGK